MSALTANPATPVLRRNNENLDEARAGRSVGVIFEQLASLDDASSFANEWWPGDDIDSGQTLGLLGRSWWADPSPVSGASSRLALTGYTRDAYGSPIGGCTVKIFRTIDDSLQSSVVSDSNGWYSITTPYADGHYLVVYRAGPPDICGTTVNTLAPG